MEEFYEFRPGQEEWLQEYLDLHWDYEGNRFVDVIIPVMHKDWLEVIIFQNMNSWWRLAVAEDILWTEEAEREFEQILLQEHIIISRKYLKKIYSRYRKKEKLNLSFPKEQPQLLLAHIYFAMHEGPAKEILYKSCLHQAAARIGEFEGCDLAARPPQGIFGGVSIRTLRALNSREGVKLLRTQELRGMLLKLQKEQGWIFEEEISAFQARYLCGLIENKDAEIAEKYRRFRRALSSFREAWEYKVFLNYLERNQWLRPYFDLTGSEKKLTEKNIWGRMRRTNDLYYLMRHPNMDIAMVRAAEENRKFYEYEDDQYTVILPKGSKEFGIEGVAQSNCVMHYMQSVSRGDVVIAFLRRRSDLSKPFITLELDRDHIWQAKGKCDEPPPQEVKEWLKKYAEIHRMQIAKNAYKSYGQFY